MTLDDLKQKATAAELALIEKVESLVEQRARDGAATRFKNAVKLEGDPPEYGSPEHFRSWFSRVMKRYDDAT